MTQNRYEVTPVWWLFRTLDTGGECGWAAAASVIRVSKEEHRVLAGGVSANHEVRHPKACGRATLPPSVPPGGAKQLNPILLLAGDQRLCIQEEAGIHRMNGR